MLSMRAITQWCFAAPTCPAVNCGWGRACHSRVVNASNYITLCNGGRLQIGHETAALACSPHAIVLSMHKSCMLHVKYIA